MRIQQAGEWVDVLDPWRAPDEARIQVHAWLRLESLDDLHITPRASLRTLVDYGREIGPLHVARKVASRFLERGRAGKWAACGLGRVIEGPSLESGTAVAFFAPRGAEVAERVVVPLELVRPWTGALPSALRSEPYAGGRFWGDWGDWQREAGRDLRGTELLMERVLATLEGRSWESATHHAAELFSPVQERTGKPAASKGLGVSVVGWGHHARTSITPNLPPELEIRWIHELDPLIVEATDGVVVDTAPVLRDEERPDVVFASGFHATHAPIAAEALRRGAWAVSEKPVATTGDQLRELLEAWREPSRYFAAFHKRYSPSNAWLREDLGLADSSPMSYFCIVHEISLPARHWYRWPSSGSRILSNGCHWIDHFLFLNDFAAVESFDAHVARTGDFVCEVTLESGAFFHMVLTDRGSDRLGTREHVEIRTDGHIATIEDGQEYRAESHRRVLRRDRFHKLAAHELMYRAIGERIVRGEPGDSRVSVERSAGLVLQIEEALR